MSEMAQMFDFERPSEKEENSFNLGAINAQTLRSFTIQIRMDYFALNFGLEV